MVAQSVLDSYEYKLPDGVHKLYATLAQSDMEPNRWSSSKKSPSPEVVPKRKHNNYKRLVSANSLVRNPNYIVNNISAQLDSQIEVLKKQKLLIEMEREVLKEKRKLKAELEDLDLSDSDDDKHGRKKSRRNPSTDRRRRRSRSRSHNCRSRSRDRRRLRSRSRDQRRSRSRSKDQRRLRSRSRDQRRSSSRSKDQRRLRSRSRDQRRLRIGPKDQPGVNARSKDQLRLLSFIKEQPRLRSRSREQRRLRSRSKDTRCSKSRSKGLTRRTGSQDRHPSKSRSPIRNRILLSPISLDSDEETIKLPHFTPATTAASISTSAPPSTSKASVSTVQGSSSSANSKKIVSTGQDTDSKLNAAANAIIKTSLQAKVSKINLDVAKKFTTKDINDAYFLLKKAVVKKLQTLPSKDQKKVQHMIESYEKNFNDEVNEKMIRSVFIFISMRKRTKSVGNTDDNYLKSDTRNLTTKKSSLQIPNVNKAQPSKILASSPKRSPLLPLPVPPPTITNIQCLNTSFFYNYGVQLANMVQNLGGGEPYHSYPNTAQNPINNNPNVEQAKPSNMSGTSYTAHTANVPNYPPPQITNTSKSHSTQLLDASLLCEKGAQLANTPLEHLSADKPSNPKPSNMSGTSDTAHTANVPNYPPPQMTNSSKSHSTQLLDASLLCEKGALLANTSLEHLSADKLSNPKPSNMSGTSYTAHTANVPNYPPPQITNTSISHSTQLLGASFLCDKGAQLANTPLEHLGVDKPSNPKPSNMSGTSYTAHTANVRNYPPQRMTNTSISHSTQLLDASFLCDKGAQLANTSLEHLGADKPSNPKPSNMSGTSYTAHTANVPNYPPPQITNTSISHSSQHLGVDKPSNLKPSNMSGASSKVPNYPPSQITKKPLPMNSSTHHASTLSNKHGAQSPNMPLHNVGVDILSVVRPNISTVSPYTNNYLSSGATACGTAPYSTNLSTFTDGPWANAPNPIPMMVAPLCSVPPLVLPDPLAKAHAKFVPFDDESIDKLTVEVEVLEAPPIKEFEPVLTNQKENEVVNDIEKQVPAKPTFVLPIKNLLRQMKTHIANLGFDEDNGSVAALEKVLRDTLREIMAGKGYMRTAAIVQLFRDTHPKTNDKEFLQNVMADFNNGKIDCGDDSGAEVNAPGTHEANSVKAQDLKAGANNIEETKVQNQDKDKNVNNNSKDTESNIEESKVEKEDKYKNANDIAKDTECNIEETKEPNEDNDGHVHNITENTKSNKDESKVQYVENDNNINNISEDTESKISDKENSVECSATDNDKIKITENYFKSNDNDRQNTSNVTTKNIENVSDLQNNIEAITIENSSERIYSQNTDIENNTKSNIAKNTTKAIIPENTDAENNKSKIDDDSDDDVIIVSKEIECIDLLDGED